MKDKACFSETGKMLSARTAKGCPIVVNKSLWVYADGRHLNVYYEDEHEQIQRLKIPTRGFVNALRLRGIVEPHKESTA